MSAIYDNQALGSSPAGGPIVDDFFFWLEFRHAYDSHTTLRHIYHQNSPKSSEGPQDRV